MAAEQRRLLEQLMGPTTNSRSSLGKSHNSTQLPYDLNSPEICKSYLVGVCPHDLFQSTKMDLGLCPLKHMESIRIYIQSEQQKGKKFPELEKKYINNLLNYINDCNKRIEIGIKKLEVSNINENTLSDKENFEKILMLNDELSNIEINIKLNLKEIEILGIEKDMIQKSIQSFTQIIPLYRLRETKKKELNKLVENSGPSGHQQLQVCTTCGAYLSRLDNNQRLAEHFSGKIHLGYVKMRLELERLKVKPYER